MEYSSKQKQVKLFSAVLLSLHQTLGAILCTMCILCCLEIAMILINSWHHNYIGNESVSYTVNFHTLAVKGIWRAEQTDLWAWQTWTYKRRNNPPGTTVLILGWGLMTVSLQAVHDAEDVLEIAKLQAEEARKKLQKVLGGALLHSVLLCSFS